MTPPLLGAIFCLLRVPGGLGGADGPSRPLVGVVLPPPSFSQRGGTTPGRQWALIPENFNPPWAVRLSSDHRTRTIGPRILGHLGLGIGFPSVGLGKIDFLLRLESYGPAGRPGPARPRPDGPAWPLGCAGPEDVVALLFTPDKDRKVLYVYAILPHG